MAKATKEVEMKVERDHCPGQLQRGPGGRLCGAGCRCRLTRWFQPQWEAEVETYAESKAAHEFRDNLPQGRF